ncbi:MAG: molybdate ABC transporter substrate-binding protein [Verrucomicrobiales bacterium]|nr:molybdate ABC transporter substrate-binding protein [Verrucomicrobiales bacterium]
MNPLPRLLLLSALFLTACGDTTAPPTPTESGPVKLTVAVAASMRHAFEEVATAFAKEHPGVTIAPTFGASGTFYAQIGQKAPFDLFLSADTEYPEKLVAEGLATETFPYATGQLVLWARKTAGLDVSTRGLEVLKDPRISKVALANPELAPYGRAAVQTMNSLGAAEGIEAKLAMAENVGQAAQFVQSGAAQVGFFAYSLTFTKELKDTGDFWLVPATAHDPIRQAGVILPGTAHPEAASALRDFLTGAAGQAILARHGFGAP